MRPVPPDRPVGLHPGRALEGDTPNFQNWRALGAQALVTGNVQGSGSAVRVEFRLWDVLPQQQIQGTAYTTSQPTGGASPTSSAT